MSTQHKEGSGESKMEQERVSSEDGRQETVRKRQKQSKVWDHFKLKLKENAMQCVHCKVELAYHNSTTSMLQQLNRKHPVHASTPRCTPDTR